MLQPIRTLRDNPNVFELPNSKQEAQRKKKKSGDQQQIVTDPEDPVTLRLQEASDNLQSAQQGQKYENLNELLIQPPERPEIDAEQVQKNKGLTKKAAVLQLIDSIAGATQLNRQQDEAVVAPNRLDQIGLSALQNLQNLDQQHKIDLKQYNQRSQQVDQRNKQLQMQMQQYNKNVDLQAAEMEYEQARQAYDQMLDEKEKKAIAADENKEWHYQAGLRLITQRKFNEARAHFMEADMNSETIDNMVEKGQATSSGGASGSGSLVAGVELDPKSEALYEEYLHYKNQVSDDDFVTEYIREQGQVVNYDKPKRGTPAWHADRIMDEMGDDFYLTDYAKRTEREAAEQEKTQRYIKKSNQQLQSNPRFQKMGRDLKINMQKQFAEKILKAPDMETAQQYAGKWMENNRQMLLEDGVPEDQIDQLTEQMFVLMMDDIRSGGSQQKPSKAEPSGNRAGMSGGGQQAEEPEVQAKSQQPVEEGGQPKPNRREALPRHLRRAYDAGDKFLEQMQRMDHIRSVNPKFDTSIGEREQKRLKKQLIEYLDRMPSNQRLAVIEALGYDPYEE